MLHTPTRPHTKVGTQRAVAVVGVVQHYSWGSTTAIPTLLGREGDGRPWAELWFGTHGAGAATALTEDGARDLRYVLAESGEPPLPYLLKILAAEQALSLQVHPTITQAEEGYAREDAAGIALDAPGRNYRDRNHKPELVVALTPFRALSGIRDATTTLRIVEAFGEETTTAFQPLQAEPTGEGAVQTLVALLNMPAEERKALVAATQEGAAKILQAEQVHPETERAAELVQLLATGHPNDVGVVVALLLNDVTLSPGEGLYQAAGSIHAYVNGVGIEVMAASDNVLRGGLTCKHVDVEELTNILTPVTETPHLVHAEQTSASTIQWNVPVEDFTLEKTTVTPGRPVHVRDERPSLILAAEGVVNIGELHLQSGEAVYIPAHAHLTGHGAVYRVSRQ